MGDFLILAVIIAIVCIAIENDQKKKKRKRTQKTGYQNRSNADTYSKRMQGNRTNPQRVSEQRKQQELKERLMRRYGEALQSGGTDRAGNTIGKQNRSCSNSQGGILSRANANVREHENDRLRKDMQQKNAGAVAGDMHSISESVNPMEQHSLSEPHPFGGPLENSELMRQVMDLIIMGYQPRLSGERDFVAEGIEMIHDFDGVL